MSDLTTDAPSIDEQTSIDLVATLLDTGNLHPLIPLMRGQHGREQARDALRVLSDYDAEMLVQFVLEHLADPNATQAALT